ncbi:hypothetical protein WICMUC_005103 [Wickerhamomyces mucosus]|uniref:Intimal thickness related receptor IRP domain-containing protein n=1 Tax=Wickerhamomyces mucosus TaxID=1378264 RepID=A0A9P8PCF1_9ASCO|nr:hypothetical protein WICMUC_005103 [Wickerhamomyces mucosus]
MKFIILIINWFILINNVSCAINQECYPLLPNGEIELSIKRNSSILIYNIIDSQTTNIYLPNDEELKTYKRNFTVCGVHDRCAEFGQYTVEGQLSHKSLNKFFNPIDISSPIKFSNDEKKSGTYCVLIYQDGTYIHGINLSHSGDVIKYNSTKILSLLIILEFITFLTLWIKTFKGFSFELSFIALSIHIYRLLTLNQTSYLKHLGEFILNCLILSKFLKFISINSSDSSNKNKFSHSLLFKISTSITVILNSLINSFETYHLSFKFYQFFSIILLIFLSRSKPQKLNLLIPIVLNTFEILSFIPIWYITESNNLEYLSLYSQSYTNIIHVLFNHAIDFSYLGIALGLLYL